MSNKSQKHTGGGWAVEHAEGTDYAPDCLQLEASSQETDLRPFDEGYDAILSELVEREVTHEDAEIYRIYRVDGVFYREMHYGVWSRWGYGEDLLEAKECMEEDW